MIQLVAIAALLSLAFFLAVRGVAEQAAVRAQDEVLAASATSIADALYTEGGLVRLELPYSALSMLGAISEDRVFYHVLVNGETLTGYSDLRSASPRIEPAFETAIYRGDELRVVTISRELSAGSVQVVVGQTRLGLAAVSSQITTTATLIGAIFFAVAISLSLWAAQTAIAPLDKLADAIARRGPNDLRPMRVETPQELAPLVTGLNGFMGRLRSALTRSEDLITEAAHRVRTPLATVRTQAEVIHRNMERAENRKALRDMIRAVDESSRSAGQLLDHAMVTFRSDQMEPETVDLIAVLKDVAHRLAPTAELKDIEISMGLPKTAFVAGDPILLQNAVRNILDNAIKYSPAETKVSITLSSGQDHRIAIADQGRGFQESDLPDLTKRFSRGSNVSDVVGSGLGLTIADDVARAHGGRIEIAHNDEGKGACVTLILPLA